MHNSASRWVQETQLIFEESAREKVVDINIAKLDGCLYEGTLYFGAKGLYKGLYKMKESIK